MLIERLRITAAQARCILERGSYGRWSLARLLRRLPPDHLIAMERITIPHWFFTLRCMMPGRYARKKETYAAVNAMTGECTWMAEVPRLVAPEGTEGLRPALVTEGEALALLRRQIAPGQALASRCFVGRGGVDRCALLGRLLPGGGKERAPNPPDPR